jgi:formylglycine-generating enzyme required for sulfatase activity
VVNVTWYDAVAYCRWLSEVTGKPYSLPSEAEWEKAARGTEGWIYPWGNDWDQTRCNSQTNGLGDTAPVGAYAQGSSPYDVLDMAGNVWEWTRSLYPRPYPYNAADGRENLDAEGYCRARGGSFVGARHDLRCASRGWFEPDTGARNLGFRVAFASQQE